MGTCMSKENYHNNNRGFAAIAPVSSSSSISISAISVEPSCSTSFAKQVLISETAVDKQSSIPPAIAGTSAASERRRRRHSSPVSITRLSPWPALELGGRRHDDSAAAAAEEQEQDGDQAVEIILPAAIAMDSSSSRASQEERQPPSSSTSDEGVADEDGEGMVLFPSVVVADAVQPATTTRQSMNSSLCNMSSRSSVSRDLAAFSKGIASYAAASPSLQLELELGCHVSAAAVTATSLQSPTIAIAARSFRGSSRRLETNSRAAAEAYRSRSLPKRFYGSKPSHGEDEDEEATAIAAALMVELQRRKSSGGGPGGMNLGAELGLSPRHAGESPNAMRRRRARGRRESGEHRVRSRRAAAMAPRPAADDHNYVYGLSASAFSSSSAIAIANAFLNSSRRAPHLADHRGHDHSHMHDFSTSASSSSSAIANVSASPSSCRMKDTRMRSRHRYRHRHADYCFEFPSPPLAAAEIGELLQEDVEFEQTNSVKQQNGVMCKRSALRDRPLNSNYCSTSTAATTTNRTAANMKHRAKSSGNKKSAALAEAVNGEDRHHYGGLSMAPETANHFLQQSSAASEMNCAPLRQLQREMQAQQQARSSMNLLKEAAMDAFCSRTYRSTSEMSGMEAAAAADNDAEGEEMQRVMEFLEVAEAESTSSIVATTHRAMAMQKDHHHQKKKKKKASEMQDQRKTVVMQGFMDENRAAVATEAAATAARVNSWPRASAASSATVTEPRHRLFLPEEEAAAESDEDDRIKRLARHSHELYLLGNDAAAEGSAEIRAAAGSHRNRDSLMQKGRHLKTVASYEDQAYTSWTEKGSIYGRRRPSTEINDIDMSAFARIGCIPIKVLVDSHDELMAGIRSDSDGSNGEGSDASFEFQIKSVGSTALSTPSTPMISRSSTPKRSC